MNEKLKGLIVLIIAIAFSIICVFTICIAVLCVLFTNQIGFIFLSLFGILLALNIYMYFREELD